MTTSEKLLQGAKNRKINISNKLHQEYFDKQIERNKHKKIQQNLIEKQDGWNTIESQPSNGENLMKNQIEGLKNDKFNDF